MKTDKGESKKLTQKRGPKPAITRAVVKRVSALVGRGVTLHFALAAEGKAKINVETWKKALRKNKEFQPLYEAGRGKFLADATQRLAKSKDLANLRWLLERRHAEMFTKPKPADASGTVNGIDYKALYEEQMAQWDEVIDRSRESAAERYNAFEEGRKHRDRELAQKGGAGSNGDAPLAAPVGTTPVLCGSPPPACGNGSAGVFRGSPWDRGPVERGSELDKVFEEERRREEVRRREGLAKVEYCLPGADC